MQQHLYQSEHQEFRATVRAFLDRHVTPYHPDWEKAGLVDRDVWVEAGRQGLLGTDVPVEYGGGGVSDFRFNAVLDEEVVRAGASGLGFGLHNDIVAPYLLGLGTEEQKQRWLPRFCSGQTGTPVTMTEPGAGSDLQNVRTHARRDGTDYLVSGSKTFITNGILSDLVIVVVRTDPDAEGARALSLLVVERGMAGFERGRNLDKIGMKAQDTAELFFDEVRVPAENLLGEPNRGFVHLMEGLPRERLSIAVVAVAACEWMLEMTLEHVRNRTAFGRPVGSFQHSRFVLAELATRTTVARTFLNHCVAEYNAGRLTATDAAMAKWWTTDLQNRVADACLQLHGGYGYMSEYPISRAYLDGRVQSIYGGTNEIMKEIVGRSLGL